MLGGSWKKQLHYVAALNEEVVSIDNNYILKQANYGSFVYPDGETGLVSEDLNLPNVTNPRYIAIAASCGNIGRKIQQLIGEKE